MELPSSALTFIGRSSGKQMDKQCYSIIGAGIGGLTTAVAFEKAGIPYQIFEKAPVLNEVGAGIWLALNALKVLESLNLLPQIATAGCHMKNASICRQDLTQISSIAQGDLAGQPPKTTIAIHRAKLQKILFDQIPESKIHLGKSFRSYSVLKNGLVEITFEDGSTLESNYLIGADGINSRVRQQLFPDSKKRYSGQTCWRGIADYTLDSEFANRGMELWGDQIRFGLSGIDSKRVYWFAVACAAADTKDESNVQSNLLKLYSDFDPFINKLISATDTDKILRNDIYDLTPLSQWHKGNICLIGDAGHATTPNMGQGGAQSIEDAYYLSNLIRLYPEENIFDRFQQKRQKKVNSIVRQSWSTGKMAHWKYCQGLRNLLLSSVPKNLIKKKLQEVYAVDGL